MNMLVLSVFESVNHDRFGGTVNVFNFEVDVKLRKCLWKGCFCGRYFGV